MKFLGLNPSSWVSLMPNGLGHIKPNHYGEMLKVAWQNRDNLPLAWKILTKGVCDGCALGTSGLKDFTLSGPHLCTVRLHLLRLNTMPALDVSLLNDVNALSLKGSKELRDLGRLPYPMIRKRGEVGFTRTSWDNAYKLIAEKLRQTDPQRMAFYLTSRGITNETYYVAQKAARYIGTNNIDNAARICHSPSTVAMKQVLGVSASTCSYRDWIGTDLLIFIGSDTPNNQPVTTKYMYHAKTHGTKIVVINPYREPGLERYWVPSVFESAVFGTRLADEFFDVHTGGDLAFLNGVLKHIIENKWIDRAFVNAHTRCFERVEMDLAQQSWEMLEKYSGVSREEMLRFAKMLGEARSAVFVWSMGITQHENGVDNVRAILNLALARGFVGREKCGVMPIRGHSGVQGGGEMGCVPWSLPGGDPINKDTAQRFSALWGFDVPDWRGMAAVEMIDAAHAGNVDVFYVAGGNFLETLPDPDYIREALSQPCLRVHQDIVLTSQMLVEPADTVILLPAATRYEQTDGGTETSTERQVIYSPQITQPLAEAKSEWEIFMELAERVQPAQKQLIHFASGQQIRDEIAKANPNYDGVQNLKKQGDHFQWGGVRLCEGGEFHTESGRASFSMLRPPEHVLPPGQFILKTRRGKQFNSMVQYQRDPLNGAMRDDVLMSRDDADALHVAEGDAVMLHSDVGEMRARVKLAKIKPRNVQVHWPEGNVLLQHSVCDVESGVPAYKAVVRIQKV
jgi:molybdopterin-dependent oxidoreductase alpha subunit